MDAVSPSGSVQVALQAVKQAVDQEANIASLIQQAVASPPKAASALDIAPPSPETGRGQIVDIVA